jgi:UDP-glucose 4-epimerase
MKALVTGSSGRLGPYVIADLEQAGHEVVLFSRQPPAASLSHLQWVQGDIRNPEDCLRAARGGFDAIHHLAAQAWPTDHPGQRALAEERGLSFDTTMQSNVMGTYYLLQAAVQHEIGIFVMTGSNCALGHGYRISDKPFPYQYLPIDEAHPSDVEDSYSYSKLAGEMLLKSYSSAYGMRTYALRSAGICNAERRANMAKNAAPAKSWNPWLWAWVGSEDVASAHRLLMEQADQIEPFGAFFCNGNDSTALEPTRELVAQFQPDLLPLVQNLDGHTSILSNQKLRETVGWEHKTSWRDLLD